MSASRNRRSDVLYDIPVSRLVTTPQPTHKIIQMGEDDLMVSLTLISSVLLDGSLDFQFRKLTWVGIVGAGCLSGNVEARRVSYNEESDIYH